MIDSAGSFEAEYQALHEGCGFVPLTDWTVVGLTGADRQNFLHNMCTNEIRKLAPGAGCEAFLTDVKGKIVAHVWVLLGEEYLTLLAVPRQAEKIIAHLDRYIIREDVQLADRTSDEAWMVTAGAQAGATLGASVSKLERAWQHVSYCVGDLEYQLMRLSLPSGNAYLLGVAAERGNDLRRHLQTTGALFCGQRSWDTLRVEAGLPLYGTDFDHPHLPQEVARDLQAISFTKGCYLGQETIARIDALGHVNQQLVTLRFAEGAQPLPGLTVTHQGQQVGRATTVGESIRLGASLALAMVRRGANDVGKQLDTELGPVEVVATPALEV